MAKPVDTESRAGQSPLRRLGVGAAVGLLSTAVALGIAELVSGLLAAPQASPVLAVGDAVVDISPAPLKNFAIETFGVYDKLALLIGISAVLVLFAVLLGALALRNIAFGQIGIVAFAAIGVLAAFTRPGAGMLAPLPTVIGAAAGLAALNLLIHAAAGEKRNPRTGSEEARPEVAEGSREAAVSGVSRTSAEPPVDQTRGTAGEEPGTETLSGRPSTHVRRRGFMLAGAGTLAVAVASGGVGRLLLGGMSAVSARQALRLPAAADPLPPLPQGVDYDIAGLAPFTTANPKFYRIDTALTVPQVDPKEWRLRIHGMVDRPIELSFDDLLNRRLMEADITMSCVSNPIGGDLVDNTRWLGVRLADVLRETGVHREADQILSTSSDGWTCGTPVDVVMDGRDAMLAIAMNNEPLPFEHGFPVRMVVPGLYGFVSATKWVVDISLTRFSQERAYWAQRGWAVEAPIKTMSRIDVPGPLEEIAAGSNTVAGVAWAQHRGIEAVEVRVDEGDWHQAELAEVPGIDTWRQWKWDWDAAAGLRKLEVRATDKTGYTQTPKRVEPIPNGASGWHSVQVRVS